MKDMRAIPVNKNAVPIDLIEGISTNVIAAVNYVNLPSSRSQAFSDHRAGKSGANHETI
jgi:hypothetical protein